MAIVKNISYHIIQTDHADEAESLAFYLNEHGLPAWVKEGETSAVEMPEQSREVYDQVEMLKQTWQLFYEYSDSGLFGLPMYVKE